MGQINERFPIWSFLSLVYPLSAMGWMLFTTPAGFLMSLGYGVANLAYLLLAAGLIFGRFGILRLKGRWKTVLAAVIVWMCGTVLLQMGLGSQSERAGLPVSQQGIQWRRVVRVVDGDTLLLDRKERVRLIGVDTPETVDPRRPVERFGKEASAFTKRMAEGKQVRLEYDQDRRDRFGRTLAYVYLEDGTFLNAEIVKQGFGHAYTQFPFKYMREFRGYEREAREAQRGLWKPE